jgi:hypothetical protein
MAAPWCLTQSQIHFKVQNIQIFAGVLSTNNSADIDIGL